MTHSTAATRNWRSAALPLAQGVLYLVKADFVADALGSFREAFDEFTNENLTPEQAAWALWCETLSCALADSLKATRVTVLQNEEELQQAIADFIGDAFQVGSNFGEKDLMDPTNFAGYKPVREAFPDFLRRIDPEMRQTANPEPLRRELDNCLRRALVQAWSGNLARYSQITARLEGPVAEGAKRQGAWMRHYSWIRDKFENAPVFSPDDLELKVKLRDVYVRLRCVRHEEIEEEEHAGPRAPGLRQPGEKRKERIAHVSTLHDEVQRWLDAPATEDDPIRIVAGGPGSGKSSFARAFACDTLRDVAWRVLLIELQHMRLSGDLREDLSKYFQHRGSTGAGFYDDPLRWRGEDTTPYVLIFDGLDELARSDVRATDLTRHFIDNLKWMLRQSSEPGRPVKALVLGRSSAAEEGRKQAELPLNTLLHALPLRPPTRRDLGLGEESAPRPENGESSTERLRDISDPSNLLTGDTADQRPLYWKLWNRASGEESKAVPEGLTHKDLDPLNAEPLLLHLLIVSGYLTPERWRVAAENRNHVYEAIFEKVYLRDKRAGRWAAAQIDRDDFFTLMECLGLATWAGGGRTGSDKDFERLRGWHAPGKRKEKFKTIPNADLAGVALQFYTRQELDDTGYEFIHKSFGEYLIARALLVAARRAENRLENTNEEETAKEWLQIAGSAELTSEILRFLRDEVRRLGFHEAIDLKEALQGLMSWVLESGMPAQALDGTFSFREMETLQRHAEGALLAVLNACAKRVSEDDQSAAIVMLEWPDEHALRRMIERLYIPSMFFPNPLSQCLSHISGCTENINCFLHCLDLFSADLERAILYDVSLMQADLGAANLRGVNLAGADLEGANLRGTFLTGANLQDANLQRANLAAAHLEGADLKAAQLEGVDLTMAIGLAQEQIDAADGDRQTKLPEGLTIPPRWLEKDEVERGRATQRL